MNWYVTALVVSEYVCVFVVCMALRRAERERDRWRTTARYWRRYAQYHVSPHQFAKAQCAVPHAWLELQVMDS